MWTDDSQKDFARRNFAVQMHHEVDPGRNVIDIHEDIILPECLSQSVVQPTSGAHRIFSAVIYENLIRHGVATIGRPGQQFSSPIAKSQNAHDRRVT